MSVSFPAKRRAPSLSSVARSPLPNTLGLALTLALTAQAAQAAPLPEASLAEADDLDRVVVTATRTAVTADESLAPVEVIDREDIQRSHATSLGALLRGRAGLDVANQGGDGKLTSVFVRGAESDHVLVLVDGIRIGSATSGAAAFQDLPLALIDRIEIVRGPRSSLYGSDAIGGVIQIFTRRDRGPANFRADVGAGSHGRREAGAGLGGSGERGWYGVDVATLRYDGINACDGIGFPVFAGCFTTEPDRDGYERDAVSLRGGLRFGDAVEVDGQWLDVRADNDFDGSFVNRSETVQRVVGTSLRWRASDALTLRVHAGRNRDASDNFLDEVYAGNFGSRRDSAGVQADLALAEDQLLTVGADWLRDRIDSDTAYDDTARINRAAFAQYQGGFGAHDVQLALRRDDNSQFGGKTTGTAAWAMDIGDGWRLRASYGTAFKAPTFDELYFPFFGNPALRPERARSAEASIAWRGGTQRVQLDVFSSDVRDLIAFDIAIFLPNNIARARLRGAELRYDTTLRQWDIAASARWLDTENRSDDANRGNALPRRADRGLRVDVDRRFGAFGIGASAIAEGARYDDAANTRRIGGYATLDLRADYRIGDVWTLSAGIANALDRDYETVSYYNQPGRTWSLRLRYAPRD
jgi:vitamin B12 transporter